MKTPVGVAFREFLQDIVSANGDLPLFEVRYRYGNFIVGDQDAQRKFNQVIPPCGPREQCANCNEFVRAVGKDRPFMVVLKGSCEEYLEYDQLQPVPLRWAPLRFYSSGESIGIKRILNRIYRSDKPIRSIFGRAARYITAGARSVYFNATVSNPQLVKFIGQDDVESALGLSNSEKPCTLSVKKLGNHLELDHSKLLGLIESAAIREMRFTPWECGLLMVPVEPLAKRMEETSSDAATKSLLIALLAESYWESRNTRSDYLRETVVADRLSGWKVLPYAVNTAHHLIQVIRGEFPGFVPHDPALGDDFGPFTAFYEFCRERNLIAEFFSGFPALLRPVHLDRVRNRYAYYSFERPSLIAAVTSFPHKNMRSRRSFAAEDEACLNKLLQERPDFFDQARCQYYISKGKPTGPRKQSGPSFNSQTYQSTAVIRADFKPQLANARARGWLDSRTPAFGDNKSGFTSAFVRLSRGQQL